MPLKLQIPIRHLAENKQGRDFVVGDLHGCASQLKAALKDINFDTSRDRLLSVGDLIDRGPDSSLLLDLLTEPWFFACLGNHEEILLRFTLNGDLTLADRWSAFGGSWFFALTPAQQAQLADLIGKHMSFAIETTLKGSSIGIVHADVPQGISWTDFTRDVATNTSWQQAALWDRRRGKGERDDSIEGIDLLYCGHQIIDDAKRAGNVWMVDTGAYLASDQRGKLTIVQLPNTLHSYR